MPADMAVAPNAARAIAASGRAQRRPVGVAMDVALQPAARSRNIIAEMGILTQRTGHFPGGDIYRLCLNICVSTLYMELSH
jgi:hypothetical protein